MNKIQSVHIFNVYSTVVYRFGCNGSCLDATTVIAYDNGYSEKNDHNFQKDPKTLCKYLDIYK